jgi:hypothetical protein
MLRKRRMFLADEEGQMPEVAGHRLCQVRPRTLAMEVQHLHVGELVGPRDERVEEHRRRCRSSVHEDLLT